MKLYLLSRAGFFRYDSYSKCVVCAVSEEEARQIHPSGDQTEWADFRSWASPDQVIVKYLGDAEYEIAQGVICASFHAG